MWDSGSLPSALPGVLGPCAHPSGNYPLMVSLRCQVTLSLLTDGCVSSPSIHAVPTVCTASLKHLRGWEGTRTLKESPPPHSWVRRPRGKETESPLGPKEQTGSTLLLLKAQGGPR